MIHLAQILIQSEKYVKINMNHNLLNIKRKATF